MNKVDFLEGLNEELEFENPLQFNSQITSHQEWDSMGAMILIGFVSNKFGVTLNGDDIGKLTDVNSLIDRIGADKFS